MSLSSDSFKSLIQITVPWHKKRFLRWNLYEEILNVKIDATNYVNKVKIC